MSPVPRSRPREAATANNDFEWPPKADEVSIYELGPDPWQALQDASRDAFIAHRREKAQAQQAQPQHAKPLGTQPAQAKPQQRRPQQERPQQEWAARRARTGFPARLTPAPRRARTLAVVAASAIAVAFAGWGLHAAMTSPVPVQAFHHPAPAVAAPPTPPPITIVATYPVEPDVRNDTPANRERAIGDAAATAARRGDTAAIPLDTMPVIDPTLTGAPMPLDAPAETEQTPGAATTNPTGAPSAVLPGATTPDGVGAVRDVPGVR
jgi:hypothetical protein